MLRWDTQWNQFKSELPHRQSPYAARNWGNPLHSLCSYQGKLKPSIAHYLVKIFVPPGGKMLDPFSGVGTIPFEAALQGRKGFAIDLSPCAYVISKAKIRYPSAHGKVAPVVESLERYIENNEPSPEEISEARDFGFNGKIADYYHEKTLKEILLAKGYFKNIPDPTPAEALVFSSILHILHGNRPYALSRNSHPITPYAPTGEFEYRPLIKHLRNKLQLVTHASIPFEYREGEAYHMDSTEEWPSEICELDAVITSPPFFDSTRFYMFNWLRMWFCGWSPADFKNLPKTYVDERQKHSFDVYKSILSQSKERLKQDGVMVLHLGKSKKCDMASHILDISSEWFSEYDLFHEDVSSTEHHGIRDKGTTTEHTYLVLHS